MESSPWFLKRTSGVDSLAMAVQPGMSERGGYTDALGPGIKAVLHEFLDDGAQVDNDLPRLDLVDLP